MSSGVSGSLSFGLIPPEHWYQPEWIDEEKATASRNQMVAENVIYGGTHVVFYSYHAFTERLALGSVSYVE